MTDDTTHQRVNDTFTQAATDHAAPRVISRRTLAKGAAWSVPAIMLASATPAYAGSTDGPTNLGALLESSATIDNQTVRMSSMYIAESTGVTSDQLNGILFDITLKIYYDNSGANTSSEFSQAGGLSHASLSDQQWHISTQDTGYLVIKLDRTIPYESSGFAGFTINYNTGTNSQGDWNGPPKGSITVTAEGTGWRSDGTKAFTISGVIMGEGANTTTPRTPEVPIVGPYFACGGDGVNQICAAETPPNTRSAEVATEAKGSETDGDADTNGTTTVSKEKPGTDNNEVDGSPATEGDIGSGGDVHSENTSGNASSLGVLPVGSAAGNFPGNAP